MSNVNIQKSAIDLIFPINTAINNIRLYPATSDLIVNSVNRISIALSAIMKHTDVVEYGEAERTLIVQGEPLAEIEQKKLPIIAFLGVMLDWKIRSISFEKGVTNRELISFIQIIGKSPEDIKHAENIRQLVKDQKITHIQIDEKIYVEKDSGQSIVAGMEITDEDIVKYVLGDQSVSKEMLESFRNLATDPEWISRVFESGVKQLMEDAANHRPEDLSEIFARMMGAFETASDVDKSEISKYLIHSLTEMNDDGLMTVLTQDLDGVFGDSFLDVFVKELDDDKFKNFIHRIQQMVNMVAEAGECSLPQIVTNRQVASLMKNIKKVRFISGKIPIEAAGDESASEAFKQRAGQLESALSSILKCQAMVSHERVMLDRMNETVQSLLSNEKYSTIVTLFGQMGHLLLNKDPDTRIATVELLAEIDEKFESTGCLEERILLSRKLTEWVKLETKFSPIYEKIAGQLQKLAQTLIEQFRFKDAEDILDAMNLIYLGSLKKGEEIQKVAAKLLQNLATEDIMNKLLQNLNTERAATVKEDIRCLVILGSVNIERLLDLLHDSQNRAERNRIVRVIIEIGAPCAQPVAERIQQKGPWFYVRNLTLLLGRIGNTSDLKLLEQLLKDKNPRIQREGVLAIQNIGGAAAGKVLYKNLYTVDDEVKSTVFSVIGTLKYREPVPSMIEMLESKTPGRSKKVKTDIMIKICEALGRMGEEKAVPVLKRIIRTKGFLTKVYDPTVRAAANDALNKIQSATGTTV